MTKQPQYRQKGAGVLSRCRLRSGKCLIIAFIAAILAVSLIFASQPYPGPKTLAKNQTLDSYENALFKYEINRYPANAEVSNVSAKNLSIGFSIDPWNLNFGIVPTDGSYGRRFITLKNSESEDVFIQLRSSGDIVPFVEFNRNDFVLKNGDSAPVEIVFRTKKDTPVGNYGGEIDVIVRQPKYGILRGVGWLG